MEGSPVRVRPATEADVESLVAFNMAMANETEGRQLDPATLRAGVRAVFDRPQRGFYLIAECDGRTAGGLLITFEWSDWRNADWWWIQSVYVEPAFRRRGIYRAMHRHVQGLARADGGVRGVRLYVECDNASAQDTYRALGMERVNYLMFQAEF
ncbi:MAG: hypothetical protein BIFFINMI_02602 [Phycisphaerae bacterium]|nr:hypothetical protein [Phycisphaerae bacterium]